MKVITMSLVTVVLGAMTQSVGAGPILDLPSEVTVTAESLEETWQTGMGGRDIDFTDVNYNGYSDVWFYISEIALSGDGDAFDGSPSTENLSLSGTTATTTTWTGTVNVPRTAGGDLSVDVRFVLIASGSFDSISNTPPAGYPSGPSPTGIEPDSSSVPFPPLAWETDTTDNVFVHATGDFSVNWKTEADDNGNWVEFGGYYDSIQNKTNPNSLRHEIWAGTMHMPIPEPGTLALGGLGLALAMVSGSRRKF